MRPLKQIVNIVSSVPMITVGPSRILTEQRPVGMPYKALRISPKRKINMDGDTPTLIKLSVKLCPHSQIPLNCIGYHAYRHVSHPKQFPTQTGV